MLGKEPLKFAGYNFDNSYSEIPIGSLDDSSAYCASTLSFSLHINKPIVGLSFSDLRIWFVAAIKPPCFYLDDNITVQFDIVKK